MNRAISGVITVEETGRPLSGMRVVAASVSGNRAEVLGVSLSGDYGRFRVTYSPVIGPVDLTVFIFSPESRLVFTEPLHRQITGAELHIRVEVSRTALCEAMH